ncbi:MAG: type VI secretion system-associated FHA domain protein TagH, partial [Pseudomonadota bacterium]
MALILRIENVDFLEDGGPVTFPLTTRPMQAGRGGGMDWVLPDPTRHMSSHNFNVDHRDGAHWLEDVSTNGTFLQGQRYRLDGPHRLQPGDRFQVGPYIIAVSEGGTSGAFALHPDTAPAVAPPGGPSWQADDDPWAVGGPLPPVDPLPPARAGRRDDFADEFIAPPSLGAAPPTPAHPPAAQGPVTTPPPEPGLRPLTAAPRPDPAALPPREAAPEPAPPAAPAPPAPAPSEVIAAFCEGAGLDPTAYGEADALEVVRQAGAALKAVTAESMEHLRARAAFKEGTRRHVERTMAGFAGNPLKTAPHPDRALEEIFFRPRAGALTGPDAFGGAARD